MNGWLKEFLKDQAAKADIGIGYPMRKEFALPERIAIRSINIDVEYTVGISPEIDVIEP